MNWYLGIAVSFLWNLGTCTAPAPDNSNPLIVHTLAPPTGRITGQRCSSSLSSVLQLEKLCVIVLRFWLFSKPRCHKRTGPDFLTFMWRCVYFFYIKCHVFTHHVTSLTAPLTMYFISFSPPSEHKNCV